MSKKRAGKFTSFYLPEDSRRLLESLSELWGVNASEAVRRCLTVCHLHFLDRIDDNRASKCQGKKSLAL